jgi:GNAT superfamily N-acetyltransferase
MLENNEPISLIEYDPCNPQHKQRFGDLNREWLERYFHVEPQDETAFANPEATVLDKGGIILMARIGDEIVGTGSLLRISENHFELAKMAVTQPYQGRGIGRKLVQELVARARALCARKLFIVSNTLLENALRLYRKHGFAQSTECHHLHYARGNITLELALD